MFEIESEHKLFYWHCHHPPGSVPPSSMWPVSRPRPLTSLWDGGQGGRERKHSPPKKSMYINEASVSSVIYIPLLMNYCAACCFVLGAERLLHLADSPSHTKQDVLIKKWAAGSTPTRTNTPDSCGGAPLETFTIGLLTHPAHRRLKPWHTPTANLRRQRPLWTLWLLSTMSASRYQIEAL